jgi:hypothetical protein
MTRRGMQIGLGLFWVLDGALQLQPYMFGRGFALDIIAPAAEGQPRFVASGVHWAAELILTHPVMWDTGFAGVQLAIGVGLLLPRLAVVRLAIVTSLGWALGVWYFGEGLGGLASGQVDLVTGAPGAVLLYAVLALAAWPTSHADGSDAARPPAWVAVPWALLWLGAAVWQALPAQHGVTAIAEDVQGNVDGAPGWLAGLDRTVASHLTSAGSPTAGGFIAMLAVIGLWGLLPGVPRKVAAGAGIVVALAAWAVGQNLGELYTGEATDPNTAPLLILFALALASAEPLRRARRSETTPRADPSISART